MSARDVRKGGMERLDHDAVEDVLTQTRATAPPLGDDGRGRRDVVSTLEQPLVELDDAPLRTLERDECAGVEGDQRVPRAVAELAVGVLTQQRAEPSSNRAHVWYHADASCTAPLKRP